jgi:hypothetical protein
MSCLNLESVRSTFNCSPLVGCILALLAFFGFSAAGQGQDSTPAEKLAARQIAQGNPGDFSTPTRVVTDAFVEELLSGRFKFKDADASRNIDVHGVTISNAVFQEPISINFEVPYRVVFDHCQFQKGIDFSGSQFDKDLVFSGSSFGTETSPVQTDSADDSDHAVQLINATIKGTVSFESGVFYLPVDFTKAHVKELDIENATFASTAQDDPDLDLSALTVGSDLSLSVKTAQPRMVEAQLLSVGRLAAFGRTGMGFFATREFFLADSHFQKLTIYEFEQWRANPQKGAVTLDGFSFQEINLYCNGAKPCDAGKMLELLDSPQVGYSPQPYLVLEQYLISDGDQDGANDAYIHMREHQRSRRMSLTARLADRVLDSLIGYGREPGRAVWWALGFVGLGMLIFNPRHMIPQNSDSQHEDGGGKDHKPDPAKKANGSFSRFWYSLDVLAPAIELGADKSWQPNPDWWFGRNYSYLHRIVGWILVPLILAALTGVIH